MKTFASKFDMGQAMQALPVVDFFDFCSIDSFPTMVVFESGCPALSAMASSDGKSHVFYMDQLGEHTFAAYSSNDVFFHVIGNCEVSENGYIRIEGTVDTGFDVKQNVTIQLVAVRPITSTELKERQQI